MITKCLSTAILLAGIGLAQKVPIPLPEYPRIAPQLNAAPFVQTGAGAPTAIQCLIPGVDEYYDTSGNRLYVCTAAGAVGTWARSNSIPYPDAGVAQATSSGWGSSLTLKTALADPGLDTAIPTEKAVRTAITAVPQVANGKTPMATDTAVQALQMPALTGDCVTSAGTVATACAHTYTAITDGVPITWNVGSLREANGTVVLDNTTATRALDVANMVNGGTYTLVVAEDGTGGAALTGGTGCTWMITGGTGTGIFPLTTTASSANVISWKYDGTSCWATVATFTAM